MQLGFWVTALKAQGLGQQEQSLGLVWVRLKNISTIDSALAGAPSSKASSASASNSAMPVFKVGGSDRNRLAPYSGTVSNLAPILWL